MSKANKPAFARPAAEHGHGGHYEQDGMTLREYSAVHLLASLGTWSPTYPGEYGDMRLKNTMERRAEWAVQQADALIAELAKVEAKQEKAEDDA